MRAVVPYVGTWIEISGVDVLDRIISVVPYVGTWIEIGDELYAQVEAKRRSLRGNVDRNLIKKNNSDTQISRSLRGNVDRNDTVYVGAGTIRSRSLRGNVDRNLSSIG